MVLTFDPRRQKRTQPPDGGNPTATNFRELCELVIDWEHRRFQSNEHLIPIYARSAPSDTAALAVHQAVPEVVSALLADPDSKIYFQDAARRIRNKRPDERQLSAADRSALGHVLNALTTDDPNAVVGQLKAALDELLKRHLTAEQAARLAEWFIRRSVAVSATQRHAGTDTARAARVNTLSECAAAMSDLDQQLAVEIVTALANGTPNRHERLRIAVRNLLREIFTLEDWAYFAKHCIEWMHKRRDRGGDARNGSPPR